MAASAAQQKRVGLAYWMDEVLNQVELVADGLRPDPVHDLRTALRRCRSLADGLMVLDSDPAWKKMRKAGKQLFGSLGELRDSHVLREWIEKLAPEGDPAARVLREFLNRQEQELQIAAVAALQEFDRAKWNNLAHQLPSRAARIPLDSPVFAQLALERWYQARALHRRALRNRTKVAFHDLRIGIKRFRYTVENFLPSLHDGWNADLKELQDALGDVHDLDVLWHTALTIKAFPDSASQLAWRCRVQEERQRCLEKYRGKMVGTDSLWHVWRAGLPKPEHLRTIGFRRLEIWAAFLDPNVRHSRHVAELATQLFDGLADRVPDDKRETCRQILRAAATMHDVGYARTNRGHHKASARMIRKLSPPLGWTEDEIRTVSLVARYHRGALPSETQKIFSALPQSKRWTVQFLGGILRFACACDTQQDAKIRRVDVESSTLVLTVRAEGYAQATPLAEHLAAARYLLELADRRPVFILPAEPQAA
jgi:CHAD domain-containing protein